jgi:hypothetical protein
MGNNIIDKFYNPLAILIAVLILFLLVIEIILNLTPPISRDALIHHLAIPKLWIVNGGFYETKWADFSYYPMNVNLLYLIPIYFKMDYLAKFIHMGFGIGTALLIYFYLKNRINKLAGILGILIFLSTPMIFRLSTEAYIDLGLVFFTTASILAFIRYRDGEFKEFKWLFLSSVAMGLALGSKYNALIAWFFLSASIVFVYSKGTGEQWKAIRCGLIFFLISLLIFSPWLIKNIILTGNPLYPLFKGFFNISSLPGQEGFYSTVAGVSQRGIFQMREMMYGESFLETLLIPIRYFFQGQDNNPRVFDGVLNPLLIILPLFAFISKSFYRDKLFFMVFSVFFILAATFLDQIRIRYILPAVPILSILTVMGLINIFKWTMSISNKWKYILTVILFSGFVLFLIQNVFYIKNYYQKISPMNYILGKESGGDFISRHVGSYPAMKFINQFTPEDSKIRLVFLARRGYYLDRIYEDDPSVGMNFIRGLVAASTNEQSFLKHIYSLGFTHLLVRSDLFNKFLLDNYSADTRKILIQRMEKTMNVIHNEKGYAVYEIKRGS